MYSTIPINWNIKSAPASPGRSRVGPAFYVFSFLGLHRPVQIPHYSTDELVRSRTAKLQVWTRVRSISRTLWNSSYLTVFQSKQYRFGHLEMSTNSSCRHIIFLNSVGRRRPAKRRILSGWRNYFYTSYMWAFHCGRCKRGSQPSALTSPGWRPSRFSPLLGLKS
jgi:hypothetical protein